MVKKDNSFTRNQSISNLKRLPFVCFVVSLFLQMLLAMNNIVLADEASATSRIRFFNQGAQRSESYNKISTKTMSGNPSTTGSNGCSIFAGLHADQWLFGKYSNETEQYNQTKLIVDKLPKRKSPGWDGKSTVISYLCGKGAKEYNYSYSESSIKNFFDTYGGILYLHVVWDGNGHYAMATGYTYHNGIMYVHVVDSSFGTTVSRFTAYNFSSFSKITSYGSNYHTGQEYWIPFSTLKSSGSKRISIDKALYNPNQAATLVKPISIQLSTNDAVIWLNGTAQTLTASVYPTNANQSILWSSNNTSVVTVSNNGVITPTGIGNAIIYAKSEIDSNIFACCNIQVKYNGTGSITVNSVIYPYKYKINNNGFNWKNGSGSISSDVNLEYVNFKIIHPNGTVKNYRYPSSSNGSIGAKSIDMTTVNSIIKFSEVKSSGVGYFEITIVDTAGRTLTLGRNFEASTSTGTTTSTDSQCINNRYYKITTQYKDPELKDTETLNGHIYQRYEASYSWTEAKEYAERVGGHLATISSPEENSLIYSMVRRNDEDWGAWLGGYRSENSWHWVTNEAFSYENWYSSEPDNLWNQENYLAMRVTEGQWRDTSNNNNNWHFFIVEFDPKPVETILLAGETAPTVEDTFSVSATVLPTDAYNPSVVFSSSNTSIATVDASTGVITAIGEGSATITATAQDGSGVTGTLVIHVNHKPVHVTGVTLFVEDSSLFTGDGCITLMEGEVLLLEYQIAPENADNQSVYIVSSNPDIVSVEDYSSQATANSTGTCTITIVTDDGDFTDTLTVNVIPTTGSCGENLTWQKNGTDLIISGTGDMYDYDNNGGPWGKEITSLILEEGITSIGANAFRYSQVSTVEWPNTLKTIGQLAFHGCKQLETLNNLPKGLEILETDAFSGCSNLNSVILPSSLKTIGGDAFQFTSLETISIPSSVREIRGNPFCCTTIQTIEVQNSDYYKIEDGVLYSKDGKTLIAYPCEDERETYIVEAGTETIRDNAFYGQKHLTNMVFPWGLKTISGYACYGINTLQSVSVPATVTIIGNNAFMSCPNLTIVCSEGSVAKEYAVEYSIPSATIDSPFVNPDFVLPSGTTVIEEEAFMGVNAKCILLPEGIAEIKAYAFANCPKLEQVYIPEDCERIATTAFSGASNLVIYGKTDSYAEFYAERRGFEFVDLK